MKEGLTPNAVVVDLDGTLSNLRKRIQHAKNKEWEEFHLAAKDDQPHMDVLITIEAWSANKHPIIVITGRNERYRGMTLQWFAKHGIAVDALLMRPDGNFDSDSAIKPQLLFMHFDGSRDKATDEVLVILEDRESMVETWRNLGFNCWEVRPGEY